MKSENFGLYSIEFEGMRLYSVDADELLRTAKEYELRGYHTIIRYPNGEIMYDGHWRPWGLVFSIPIMRS